MTTIRDVSKYAKVSIATVSRVINNDTTYKMTEETRNRVWAAIRELNYVPRKQSGDSTKPALTSSSTEKSGLRIGCILSITEKKYNDPYFVSILSGVETRLKEKGCDISFVKTGPEMEDIKNLYNTFAEPVSGLILMVNLSDKSYDYVRSRTASIVGIDTTRGGIDNVGYDHHKAAHLAVSHLIAKGHRKIGYIGGGGLSGNIRQSKRYKGYYASLHEAGLEMDESHVIDCAWNEDICIEKVTELIRANNYPTAFFVGSDLMAMAAMSCFHAYGISIPEEVAFIGLSNIEVSKYSNPPLTTIDIPTREIGFAAVDLLVSRLSGDTTLPKNVFLPTEVINRSST